MTMINRVAGVLTLTACALYSVSAAAEVSYNVGYASEYHFRGILQKTSSASAGVDFEQDGFYIGTWAADVGDGLEVDGYLGYGIEMESGLSASVGFTGYYYTGTFDDTYQEVNLNLGYQMFGLEYSIGTSDNLNGPEADYDFLALTVETEQGFYGKYGTFGDEFDGDYFEVGYSKTISDIDFGVSLIFANAGESDLGIVTSDESLAFTIGKTF